MNLQFLAALPSLKKSTDLRETLTRLLTESGVEEPITIRYARDKFSTVNRRAKEGHIQVIKGDPGQETIIVSIADLAAMLHATLTGITLAEALAVSGFEPVRGRRLVLEEGLNLQSELVLNDAQIQTDELAAAASL